MNYAVSAAERAIVSVDHFLNRAMTYAWTSTLQSRCPGKELPPSLRSSQPPSEEDYGGGDLCSPERAAHANDDQPLA